MSSRSRSSAARLVAGLALLVTTAGCGIGAQDRPDVVADAESSAASPAATDTTKVPLTVQVYLLRGDHLVRVSRSVPDGTGLQPCLTGLFADVAPTEVAAGLRTDLPKVTKVPSGQLVGPIAEVSMPTGFDRLSVRDQVGAMSQLVYTITSNTVATEVQLVSKGRDLPVPDGVGRILSRPVNPADYATWAPTGT